MAKITATTYEKPSVTEKLNPFIDHVKQFADAGIDTAFKVEFEADDYKAEKLLIQKAVNSHGFSAREVLTDWTDEKQGKQPVKSTFVIRPMRKRMADGAEQPVGE